MLVYLQKSRARSSFSTKSGVAPAPINAAMMERIPMGRAGAPDDIGGTAVWMASRSGSYLTGTVVPVSGGLSAL